MAIKLGTTMQDPQSGMPWWLPGSNQASPSSEAANIKNWIMSLIDQQGVGAGPQPMVQPAPQSPIMDMLSNPLVLVGLAIGAAMFLRRKKA